MRTVDFIKTLNAVALIALTLGAGCTPTAPNPPTPNIPSDWQTQTDPQSGLSFSYPTTLNKLYIREIDWPPQIQMLNAAFQCNPTESSTTPPGSVTETRVINDRTFCVTTAAEGAAGSTYTQYTYAFAKAEATAALTFTLRTPQCLNYPEPQQTACVGEQQDFDIDALVDSIIKTLN